MRLVVEEISDGIAVCRDNDDKAYKVAVDALSAMLGRKARENDVLEAEVDGKQIISATADDEARDETMKQNADRLARIFAKSKPKQMREYEILTFDSYDGVDWAKVPVAPIDTYPWLKEYEPEAGAQVVMLDGFGFVAHLYCREDKPMAKRTEFFSDVWCDSCLEFFASWDNTKTDYINIEMNSISTSHIALGAGREGRTKLTDLVEKPFYVRSVVREGKWSVTAFVPFDDLEKIYGIDRSIFKSGYSFRGNFYKCGDETAVEHYGVWNNIDLPQPDYHVPMFFGKLTIK